MTFVLFISLIFLVNAPLECLSGKYDNMNDSMSVDVDVDASGSGSGNGVTPSLECVNAQLAVAANQPCFKAVMSVAEKLPNYQLPLNSDLREFCTPSCRKLNLQLSDACTSDDDDDDDIPIMMSFPSSLDLVCTVRGSQSCYSYLLQQVSTLVLCETVRPSRCSLACKRNLQKFVNIAGCCARHLLEFSRQSGLLQPTVIRLFSVCRINERQRQSACQVLNEKTVHVDCPYEGQISRECAPHPSCLSTCDILNGVAPAHPCPEICAVDGCFCPNGTVFNEVKKKCVAPSECDACPVKGQIRKDIVRDPHCSSTCESVDGLMQGPCYEQDVRYGCECPDGEVINKDKNECISPKECACRIKGQIREDCAPDPSCFQTCDIKNGITSGQLCLERCVINGCVCPNGTVLNEERTECVTPDQCKGNSCKITQINAAFSQRRRMVKITFSANEPTARFKCKLDNGPIRPCKSPLRENMRDLRRGRHRLIIIARCAGIDDASKKKTFRFNIS